MWNQSTMQIMFLMHRVELKELVDVEPINHADNVPNAPCGVESFLTTIFSVIPLKLFLMHRVELKVALFKKDTGAVPMCS